jgi:hypothetical protein
VKYVTRVLPLSLEKRVPIAGDVHFLMAFGVVVEGSKLIGVWLVGGDDRVTTIADVLLSISDHKSSFNSVLFKPSPEMGKSD